MESTVTLMSSFDEVVGPMPHQSIKALSKSFAKWVNRNGAVDRDRDMGEKSLFTFKEKMYIYMLIEII